MTKTQQLIRGLTIDGWTPVKIARTGQQAYTKRLPYKDSPNTYQAWVWVGGGATLRFSRDDCITHSVATPKRAARMIALGAPTSAASLLNELEGI